MRNQQHYTDYNHIRVYGNLMGWHTGLIHDQQVLAYMRNAPYDTCMIDNDTAIRFYDLDKSIRQQFNGVVINGKG